jgi:C_GCAxxG_C_C family probable redox protein
MIDADLKLDPSIATGFGGGLSRNGFVCGAVAAGAMIIGLKGRGKGKKLVYPVVDRFLNDFKSRFGSVNCRELIGVDLKTEEGIAYFKKEGHEKCSNFVCYAADTVCELINNKEFFD